MQQIFLIFHKQSIVMVARNKQFCLPQLAELDSINYQSSLLQPYEEYHLASLTDDQYLTKELQLINLRQAFELVGDELTSIITTSQQWLYYQQTNQFCTQCATKTQLATPQAKYLSCQSCQREIYPQIAPAMIVAVIKDQQLLMAQGVNFAPQVWSVLAGYCEVGESLEQTVSREVYEEVGISVKNIRYYASQSWPFPNSLMIGFVAEYAGGEIKIDQTELRQAGFFSADQLPGRPSSKMSIANCLIDDFILGKLI